MAGLFDLFDLTGKVAVITGGAGGIDTAMTLGMAKRGADKEKSCLNIRQSHTKLDFQFKVEFRLPRVFRDSLFW